MVWQAESGDRVDEQVGLDIKGIQAALRTFAADRDWDQFHSPKNLSMALSGEVGELVEIFQWLSEADSADLNAVDQQRAAEEIADIQIYLLRLADILGVDLSAAVADKIALNETKYPVSESKGNATKYSQRS